MSNLNYNFLNSLQHWGDGLAKVEHEMKHKHEDFRQALNPNTMEAGIWMVEELKKVLEEHYMKEEGLNILVLNSWLGIPLVPLLCENLSVGQLHLVDIDPEALELSKVFNGHYIKEEFIKINHWNLDVPFAFDELNQMNVDVVISLGCEQMYPLQDLYTANKHAIFACQSSNVMEEMYGINCVDSELALIENIGLKDTYYSGKTIQYYYSWDGKKFYDRFMAIGKK
jgi:hypothetical protein